MARSVPPELGEGKDLRGERQPLAVGVSEPVGSAGVLLSDPKSGMLDRSFSISGPGIGAGRLAFHFPASKVEGEATGFGISGWI